MGTVLAVGGWVEFEDVAAKDAWRSKKVASVKLSGWDGPMDGPGTSSPLDKHTIAKLWEEARDAPEPIEIAETETGLRFAAALSSVTGREVWAPAFFAAIRRAAGSGQGGAWAVIAEEGGSVFSVDVSGKGSFRCLEEDDEAWAAMAEPELSRAFALISGDAPPPTLAELPPRERAPTTGTTKGAKATASKRKGEPAEAKAAAKEPPLPAKPAPRLKKINVRDKAGARGAARLAGGDVVMVSLFGLWIRGNIDTNTWTSSPRGLGKQWWITTQGPRIWLGTDEGLFVSDDDGTTFVQRQPWDDGWGPPLFVDGAILINQEGQLARSTDDGATWVSSFPEDASLGAAASASGTGPHANRIVAVGAYGRIAVSDDLGQTFTLVRDGDDEAFNNVCIDGDDVYVAGSSRILRAPLASPGDVVDIGPARKRHADFARAYASEGFVWVTGPLRLLRSRDRGVTWETIVEAQTVFTDVLVLGQRRLLVSTSDKVAYLVEG